MAKKLYLLRFCTTFFILLIFIPIIMNNSEGHIYTTIEKVLQETIDTDYSNRSNQTEQHSSGFPTSIKYKHVDIQTETGIETIEFDKLTYDRKRQIAHCRDIDNLSRLRVKDGMGVIVTSFCDISLGERMFQDARSYFNALTRNAEAFSLIAERLKDTIFLTDDELYQVAVKYSESHFDSRNLSILSGEQKIQLAKELHFKYKAANQQIRRILRLELSILNEMFP